MMNSPSQPDRQSEGQSSEGDGADTGYAKPPIVLESYPPAPRVYEVELEALVSNNLGIHARPSLTTSKLAGMLNAAVGDGEGVTLTLRRPDGETADASSVMQVICMAAVCGTTLVVKATGELAQQRARIVTDCIATMQDNDDPSDNVLALFHSLEALNPQEVAENRPAARALIEAYH